MFHAPRLSLITVVFLSLVLTGCGSSSDHKSGTAYVRLLNVSPDYESLDLYADDTEDKSSTKTRVLTAVDYEVVSDYVALGSSTYSLELRRSGVSGALRTLTGQALTDDSHVTYIAYGSKGQFSVLSLGEDVEAPDPGYTLLQVLVAAEGVGALDVYFTEPEVSLDNVSPQLSSVGTNGSVRIDSGTYRLRITGANNKDDIRLDLPEVTLESREVVSFILTSTQGGVLVNALRLPQQGSLVVNRNTKARVRGAVGIANGLTTTIRVAGVTLLSNATTGAIGSRYAQVDSGNVAVNIGIDGTPSSATNYTLAAGGDYTLLVWDDATGAHTTLIPDDNKLPSSSGDAKLRIINGMSGFGGPINLAIDYSPIAEGVALGRASDFVAVDSGSAFQLDVTGTNTATNLLTRTDVTLQSGAVYTFFVAGGQSSERTSGILRKDR